jgi:hypothetical protein
MSTQIQNFVDLNFDIVEQITKIVKNYRRQNSYARITKDKSVKDIGYYVKEFLGAEQFMYNMRGADNPHMSLFDTKYEYYNGLYAEYLLARKSARRNAFKKKIKMFKSWQDNYRNQDVGDIKGFIEDVGPY